MTQHEAFMKMNTEGIYLRKFSTQKNALKLI